MFDADVIVVGGGLSGCFIAEKLSAARLSCLVLEAGPLAKRQFSPHLQTFKKQREPLLDLSQELWNYKTKGEPHDWLRVRAAGGRSLLWGGWCTPMEEQNFIDAKAFEAPWPIKYSELNPYFRKVVHEFSLRKGIVTPPFLQIKKKLGLTVKPKVAALHTKGFRPIVALDRKAPIKIRPHIIVTNILLNQEGRITGVRCFDLSKNSFNVLRAKTIVLCASPIETSRILLSSDDLISFTSLDHVGKGLVDHMVASYLVITPQTMKPTPTNAFFPSSYIPRFVNLGRTRKRDYLGGFIVELKGPLPLSQLEPQMATVLGLSNGERKHLSYFLIHAIGETTPSRKRHLSLSAERDAVGRRIPIIHWSWGTNEKKMIRDMNETAIAIADAISPPGGRVVPFRDALQPGGIAHEAGTCRMGQSPKDSVTNSLGAVHGVRGLFIADASVMPTALDRYPTMTVLALALRTADTIVGMFKRGEL